MEQVQEAVLTLGTDGNFYGMTSTGGSSSYGTIFKITSAGTFTLLNGFNGGVGGNAPFESLVQSTKDNAYYGTTTTAVLIIMELFLKYAAAFIQYYIHLIAALMEVRRWEVLVQDSR